MARISSLSEKPISHRPRRLADWLNPTGARKATDRWTDSTDTFGCTRSIMHLCESPVREIRTLGLSGGRRLAPKRGASSDPTGSLGYGRAESLTARSRQGYSMDAEHQQGTWEYVRHGTSGEG